MKSVVVEIKDGFAAVLSDDGSIVKVKNKNYVIGQVIGMKNQKRYFTKKVAMIAASAATVAVVSGVGVWAYSTPYTYVSLDVNPSIEYEVNRFGVVIDVEGVNDDGQAIVDELNVEDLNNIPIEEAIQQTVEQITEEGYFAETTTEEVKDTESVGDGPVSNSEEVPTTDSETGDEVAPVTGSEESSENTVDTINGGIVITVSNMDGNTESSEGLAEEIREVVEEVVSEDVELEVASVGYQRVQEARALGVTPGKLNLVQKLQASVKDASSISTEEWLKKPVKDIMKEIKVNRKADASEVEDQQEVKEEEVVESTTETEEVELETAEEETEDKEIDNEVKEADKKSKEVDKKVEKKAKEVERKADKKDKEVEKEAEEKVREATENAREVDREIEEKAREAAEKAREAEREAKEKAREAAKKYEEIEDTEEEADESESDDQNQDKKSQGSEQGKGNVKKR